ncbi:MAG: sensor histidine kinase [Bacteroidetes bacterium]|nr:sensor histidine kinase [Bacteroidota bacterium]
MLKHICKTIILLVTLLIANDSFAAYTDSMLREIQKAGNDNTKLFELYSRLSFSLLKNDLKQSTAYGLEALKAAKATRDNQTISRAYICLTYAYDNSGHIDEGLLAADSALIYANKTGLYKIKFRSELLVASLSRRKANYNASITHAINALKLAEDNKNDTFTGNAFNFLGILYTNLHNLDKAKQYHLSALNLYEKIKDSSLIERSLNNLGINHREREEYDSALVYYFKALNIVASLKDTSSIAFLFNDIGAAYSKKGDVLNGEKYLKESIAIRERIGEMDELAYTYNYLGENYERKKDIKNAELYIKKALSTAKDIGNNKQTYEALESLSDFYSRNKIYDSAYTYLRKYKSFRDSIAGMDNKKLIEELSTKYETAKKEKEIQSQKAEINRKNYMIIGALGILALGALLGFSYYRRYKLKQQTRLQEAVIHQQELATRAVIEAEEKERKRIAGDLHDGVGQLMSAARLNLSIVNQELTNISDEQRAAFDKALALVDESCKEVRTVSHNIMPNALLKSGLTSAIREFIDKIDSRVLKVNLFTEGINERLTSDTETVLYRVIQECINNVIKHSGANTLHISIIKDEDGISITIEDNGKGFNASDKSKFDGIGLKNIQTRIEYLKGEVEWDSAPGKGTVVSIHIPAS